jgi:hypothetical protein
MVLNGYSKAVVYTLNKSLKAGISERKIKRSKHPPSPIKHKIMTQEQYVLSARDIINNLLEAIPKQTENADWWEDSLTNAVHNAKVFVEETISPAATASDYEEVLEDHRRLVRELDVILNGEGAAKQASLCDIVAQLKKQRQAPAATVRGAEEMLKEAEKIFKGMRDSPKDGAGLHYIKENCFLGRLGIIH